MVDGLIQLLRADHVEQLESLALRLDESRAGRVVLVCGGPGSGRSVVLRAAFRAVDGRDGIRVVAGSFSDGGFEGWPTETPRSGSSGIRLLLDSSLEVLANSSPAASDLSLGAAIARLALAIAQVSLAAREVITRNRRGALPTSFADLKEVLRSAAQQDPIVCILDDIDLARGGLLWADFLRLVAYEVAADLPLLLVASVSTIEDNPTTGGVPDILTMLGNQRLIESWMLSPLTAAVVAPALGPSSDELIEILLTTTAGNARFLAELWTAWQSAGVVARTGREGEWRLVDGRDDHPWGLLNEIVDKQIRRCYGPDVTAYDVARLRAILTCASLEGPVFTSHALAEVVQLPADELIDLLDDHLTAGDPLQGVLFETTPAIIRVAEADRSLWRYAFHSYIHWLTCQRLGIERNQRLILCRAYAESLKRVYASHQALVARQIARLYAEAGDVDQARHYGAIAAYTDELDVVRPLAARIRAEVASEERSTPDGLALTLLMHAARLLRMRDPRSDVMATWEAASAVASRLGDTSAHAQCLTNMAELVEMGGAFSQARALLEEARAAYAVLGDRYRAAEVTGALGHLAIHEQDYERAVKELTSAAEAARVLDAEELGAYVISTLAHLYGRIDEWGRAIPLFDEALDLFDRQLSDRHRLGLDGTADLLGLEMRHLQALYSRAVGSYVLGDLEDAKHRFEQLRSKARDRGFMFAQAQATMELGRIASDLREFTKATTFLLEALILCEDADAGVRLSAQAWHYIADFLTTLERPDAAICAYVVACALYEALPEVPGASDSARSLREHELAGTAYETANLATATASLAAPYGGVAGVGFARSLMLSE